MKNTYSKLIITNALLSMGLISYAITPTSVLAVDDFSLSVEPSVASLTIEEPQDQKRQSFTLINNTDKSQSIRLQVFPIKEIDKKTNRLIYQPISSLNTLQQSFYESAISFEANGRKIGEITLAPKQSTAVEVVITYPQDQQVGEYYFTIGFIETQPSSTPSESEEIRALTKVSGAVGSHMLVSLGERSSELVIRELSTNRLTSNPEPNIALRIENTTAKHTKVYSHVTITNMLGFELASGSLPDSYILGNQVKEFDIKSSELDAKRSITSFLKVGVNTIKIDLYDTEARRRISRKIYYLVLPIKEAAVFLATLLLIMYIKLRIKKKRV